MKIVNIHEAKTHLSRLIDEAVAGQPFVIAKAGTPLVKVSALPATPTGAGRLGFMRGQIEVPEDFDELGRREIEPLFDGDEPA